MSLCTRTIRSAGRLALLLALAACVATPGPQAAAETRVTPGQDVKFEVITADRLHFESSELAGNLVVLHFWAAVSEPSIQYLPDLQRVHAAYRSRGVVVVSVSVDPDPSRAHQAIRQWNLRWPQAIDTDQPEPLHAQFFSGRYGVPHAFLISPRGNLLWDGHVALLDAQILKALRENPPYRDAPDQLGTPLAPPGPDPTEVGKLAMEAMYQNPPDFRQLFNQVDLLPADAIDQAKIKSFGRSIQRTLDRLNAEQQEVYDLYRSTYPDTAEALDQWLERSARSISVMGDGDDGTAVNPEIVTSRFKQAEQAEADGDRIQAYELYRWIVSRAPASDEALLAQDVVLILESDPQFMAEFKAHEQETQAQQLISMGRNYLAANLKDKAEQTFRQVIADYPDSDAAAEAATLLVVEE